MPLARRVFGVDVCVLGPPQARHIQALSESGGAKRLTYEHQQQSLTASPPQHFINHVHERIGRGKECFKRASEALRCGKALELPWVRVWRLGGTKWRCGDVVVIAARVLPLVWSVNVNRVVTVTDERDLLRIAWGTTQRHMLQGEESVSVHARNGEVEFELRSFSKANCAVAAAVGPVIRMFQRRFARDVRAQLMQIGSGEGEGDQGQVCS